ncbi:MAG: hypothetical protein VKJ85_15420 [Prochlorothrix sp.]|nr:hypothetical protein [Prochlorothrix sp.]
MAQATRFWDKIADRYSKMPIADEAAYQNKLDITRGYFRSDMEGEHPTFEKIVR